MSSPDISVVTPSYNQANFIRDTLDSVRNQRNVELEHIVMDGGSTDGTQRILKSLEDDYNLMWHSEPDDGQSDAVNKGFELASGDIVGWLNSDDVYLTPDTLSKVKRCFEMKDRADILYGDIAEIDIHSQIRRLSVRPDFALDQLKINCYIAQPSTFFRQQVVNQEQLRTDLNYCMDYEYWLRLSNKFRFKHIPFFCSGFRRYSSQKSQTEKAIAEKETMLNNHGIQVDDKIAHFFRTISLAANWRLSSLRSTVDFYRNRPDLAFDGSVTSLPDLLSNLFLPDRILWD